MKKFISLFTTLCIVFSILGAFTVFAEETAVATLNIGDYVQMGTYYDTPILWRCVSFEKIKGYDENGVPITDATDTVTEYRNGYLPLMLSDRTLCFKPFDAKTGNNSETGSHSYGNRSDYGSNYWADSNMRSWLNSSASAGNVEWLCGNPPIQGTSYSDNHNAYDQEAGFMNSFSQTELEAIQEVTQKSILSKPEAENNMYTSGSELHKNNTDISAAVQNYTSAYSENVTDKIFLLDVKQIDEVYANKDVLGDDYHIGRLTKQCVRNSDLKSESIIEDAKWSSWLRTPYADSTGSVRNVNFKGIISNGGALNHNVGVRPALFLMENVYLSIGEGTQENPYLVDEARQTPPPTATPIPTPTPIPKPSLMNMNVGDYVQMGTYDGKLMIYRVASFQRIAWNTDNNVQYNKYALTNTFSDTQEDGYYPLMFYVGTQEEISANEYNGNNLCEKRYSEKGEGYPRSDDERGWYGTNYWEDCNLKTWLNSDEDEPSYSYVQPNYASESGFLKNFTDAEKMAMVHDVVQKTIISWKDVSVDDESKDGGKESHKLNSSVSSILQNYDTAFYKNTKDTVFIPDITQIAEVYSNLNSAYKVNNEQYWLRDAYASNSRSARLVYFNGSVLNIDVCNTKGVRPAFFLDLTSTVFTEGNGTSANPYKNPRIIPYEINTVDDFIAFRDAVNSGHSYEGETVTLNADIDMSEKYGEGKESWTPIGDNDWDNPKPFLGTFDGCNHTVNNLYINIPEYTGTDGYGLFGMIDGTLKNLNVKGSVIADSDWVAGLVVRVGTNGTVINCSFNGAVKGNYFVGGIATYTTGLVSDCHCSGTIDGEHMVGGIVGNVGLTDDNYGIVQNCINESRVTGNALIAGIAGAIDNSKIVNCINNGNIVGVSFGGEYNSVSDSIGGIAGMSTGIMINCYNTCTVSGDNYIGGLIGEVQGSFAPEEFPSILEVKNCYNIGNVIGLSEFEEEQYISGTIARYRNGEGGTISNCYYLNTCVSDTQNTDSFGTAKTSAQFASGEVAYLLNSSTSEGELNWYQNIGTDIFPVLDNTHSVVLYDGEHYYNDKPIETHTHTLAHHAAVTATCTENGTGEYWACEGTDACNKMFSDKNGTAEITEIPTTAATGHIEVTDARIEPTCETDGKTAGSHCSVCQTVITAQTTIPKLKHNWGAWSISTEPTLTTTGKAERICGNNNTHKDNVDLPILTDTTVWTEDLRIEPTETADGSVAYTSPYGNVTIIIPALKTDYDYSIKYENGKAIVTVPQDSTYTVIFAAYDNGRLLSANAQDIQLVKGENPPVSPQNFNANGANIVKIMLWDSLMGMKPLGEAETIPLGE